MAQENCRLSISGQVTHLVREPLPGAVLYIVELRQGTTADENGRYRLEELCPGRYTLVCQFVGHHPDTTVVVLGKSQRNVDFGLEETPETLEEVTVRGNQDNQTILQVQQTLQGTDLQRVEGASLGEMLKVLPGLNSLQTGSSISKPVIHGLHSNRVLILNNGIRQEGQQWGSEHAPEIDPFVAKRLTVVKGAASVRYGADAIGGVILVEPDPLPKESTISGEVNLLGFSNNRQGTASGVVQGGLNKWKNFGWRLQGTYKIAGTARTPDYYLTNTQFRERNFSASAGYQTDKFGATLFFSRFSTDIGIFSGAHIGNQTDLQNAIRSPRPLVASVFSYQINRPNQDVAHSLLKAQTYYHTPLGKFTAVYGYQYNLREEYDLFRGSNTRPSTSFRLYTNTAEVLWEHKPINRNITGTIGLSSIYQGNDVGGRRIFLPNFNNFGIGVFAIERWAKNQWEVEAGLRYDYRHLTIYRRPRGNSAIVLSPEFVFNNLSGSVGTVYKPRQNVEWRLNLGSAWRPPTAAELYSDGIHHGAAAYEKGDSTITNEQSYQAVTSLNWRIGDKWELEVGGYYNRMDGFIYLKPDSLPQLTIAGAFPAFTYTQVNAVFQGVDATAKYNFLPGFSWQGKVALVRATNQTGREFLPFIPTDRIENSVRYEKERWGKLSDVFLSVNVLNVAEQRRLPPVSTRSFEQTGVVYTVYIGDFAPPPAGYTLVGADLGFSFRLGKQLTDVSLSAQNLGNVRYRDYLNRFRYFADETGRNIILKVKFRF
ncbi:MAG: TonB-dependent receptor [Cytophagales bacterium]|nr:TonB-dependent receptor [Cytophagales bacterium]